MPERTNALGQPIGAEICAWTPPPHPPKVELVGRYCHVEPIDAKRHAGALFDAFSADAEGRLWTYLGYGPFASVADYRRLLEGPFAGDDPQFYAFIDRTHARALGAGAYLRVEPANGVIEVGHLCFSPAMQRRPMATEAIFLMMRNAFELGYRRFEWKCDALNEPSRRAAERYGFSFEGVFRHHMVTKGRNRDTAWYAIIDDDWPRIRLGFERWLAPDNFDANGRQRQRLAELIAGG